MKFFRTIGFPFWAPQGPRWTELRLKLKKCSKNVEKTRLSRHWARKGKKKIIFIFWGYQGPLWPPIWAPGDPKRGQNLIFLISRQPINIERQTWCQFDTVLADLNVL